MNTSMVIQSQLLATKFFVLSTSGTLVSRPRLNALLDESLKYPLTLVSAPAGFGNQLMYTYQCSHFTTVDKVRLWLACRDLDRATRWAAELDLKEQHGTPFTRGREEGARARILLAKKLPHLALQRLEPVLQRATPTPYLDTVLAAFSQQGKAQERQPKRRRQERLP